MKKLSNFLCLLLLTLAVVLAGCNSGEANKADAGNNKNAAAAETNKPADAISNEGAKTDVAAAGDEIGVPECDNYVKKYEACVFDKVPEQMRGPLKSSFEMARKQWKEAAGNPQTKGTLAAACKQAHEAAKQSMASYSCEW